MKLHQLSKNMTLLETVNWKASLEVSAVVSDSRHVKQGALFVACPGPDVDGQQFIQEAFERGARVAVGEKMPAQPLPVGGVFLRVPDAREALSHFLNQIHGFPAEKMRLIGVTGTNGKTTIAYLLNHLLRSRLSSAYIGTLGVDAPRFKQPLSNTTPGAEELFSILAKIQHQGGRTVALEVSSHSLDQKRVLGLQFELAIFTQLSAEHLDYHQSLENYFQAKRLLFTQSPRPRQMLINRDSDHGRQLLKENPLAESFSIIDEADYFASEITTTFEGSEFLFHGPLGKCRFRTQVPFLHNVSNITATLASLDMLGFNPSDFQEPLEKFSGIPGRLERIDGIDFRVFVDYAHTPDAFEHILSEARRLQPKRVLTLFGCGGDRDPFKRPEMARIAFHYSDLIILTSDNPRTEDPAEIVRQMRKGLPEGKVLPHVLEIPDRREAIQELLSRAETDDALFILGKGHEDYQILGKQKIHFDDREVVKEILTQLRRSRVSL